MTYISINVLLYFRPLEEDEGNEMVPVRQCHRVTMKKEIM